MFIDAGADGLVGIDVELGFFVESEDEVIAVFGTASHLGEIAKLPVGDPEAWSLELLASGLEQVGNELGFVDVCVGMGGHGDEQSGGEFHGDECSAAESASGFAADGLEAFGSVFEGLAIEDEDGERGQAGGQCDGGALRQKGPQALGAGGEEGFAECDGSATQFSIEGLDGSGALLGILVMDEGRMSPSAIPQQGVVDEIDHVCEGEGFFERPASMSLEQIVEEGIGQDLIPK